MRLILRPLERSYDLVAICDSGGQVCGAVHLDTFFDRPQKGPIYRRLEDGHEVEVEVSFVVTKKEAARV